MRARFKTRASGAVRPMPGYPALLACPLIVAFGPDVSPFLPKIMGY
jgi:hypothetical protein